ncbi:N-acetylmuramoyl-L-alanine amidase [Campylobacter sp. CCUG 57310]|uniref:N-acetylmuramoyl-L-alanine amidase family protein n=1 Tax=Campylobacter sp. CCUG 57310 TaxID=2517362 RepID=UPI0020B16B3F|nr:N-acetylmuramoyl-L-alanine amidase [Campylobacter sp. CCUG 57310]QKF92541.1 N-acetylmuramoyl-L-alanine amidase [Campylobacter sp. CCUG 57310]
MQNFYMAKIGRILLLLLLIVGFSYADSARLKKFDSAFTNASKKVKLELHHDMKSLYIKSIIDNDTKTKIETLKRLIESSKALQLDAQPYEKELATINQGKNIGQADTKSTKTSAKKDVKKQTYVEEETIIIDKDSTKKNPLKILAIIKNEDSFEIKFNQPLHPSDIKHMLLNTQGMFRNVYDFRGVWTSKSHTFKDVLSEEVRVSQFDKNTIRVVFSNKKEQKLDFYIDANSVHFIMAGQKKPALKVAKDDKQKSLKQDKKQVQNEQSSNKGAIPIKKTGGKTIVLDAGHGGDDPGAINGKLKEKNIVLNIALKTGDELKKRGYKVFYTRTKDKFINLRSRTKLANDKLADLFISIHANAAPNKQKGEVMQGIETFFLSPARSERSKNVAALENKSDIDEMNFFSKQTFLNFLNREKIIASNKLAIDIQREVLARTKKINSKVVDGGVREAPFWVLVGALMPAVLLEVGYISHPDEGKLISKSNYQDAIAKGIANGVDVYFANQQ